jgi:hypothetical protein
MTQADLVHSTPPLNTSATLEANPPQDARAESLDSFSAQSAIKHWPAAKRISDSPKPDENDRANLSVLM